MRGIFAVAGIEGDVVGAHDAFAAEGWSEHRRIARHPERLECCP
jgi:hypothetical protein